MEIAGYVNCSDEVLDDIQSLKKTFDQLNKIQQRVLLKIENNKEKVAINYSMLVLDLISAKRELKALKKSINERNEITQSRCFKSC